jgi:hypothetical protein
VLYGILLTNRRAGCPPDSQQMKDLLAALSKSDAVETFGFYSRMSFLASTSCSRLHHVCCLLSGSLRDRQAETGIEADIQISDNLTLPKH